MKKKLICLALALCCVFALVACADKDKASVPDDPSADGTGTPPETSSPPDDSSAPSDEGNNDIAGSDGVGEGPEDPTDEVKDSEVVLSNGICLGMKYQDVYKIIEYSGEAPNLAKPWVKKDGVVYMFATFENEICLEKMVLDSFAQDISVFRGVKITDSAKSVISKLSDSVSDIAKGGVLYGDDMQDPDGYARIIRNESYYNYVSNYILEVYTPNSLVEITYLQAADRAEMISVTKRVSGAPLLNGKVTSLEKTGAVVHSKEYNSFVTETEAVMNNGVRLGMSMEEVYALTGYDGNALDPQTGKGGLITADGVNYSFAPAADGFTLTQITTRINIYGSSISSASVLRDIKPGDSIDSVFKKLPTQNTELRQWALQVLYGESKENPKGYAELTYSTKYGNYSINIYTSDTLISISVPAKTKTVENITLSQRTDSLPQPSDPSLPRVTSDEVVLSNKVKLGMSYREVYELLAYTGAAPSKENLSVVHQGDTYNFVPSGEDYILQSVKIQKPYLSLFRGLKIQFHIEALFERIPAVDTGLKEWAVQNIYGKDENDPEGYACLKYSVKERSYSLIFYTSDHIVTAIIPNNVRYITEINMELR